MAPIVPAISLWVNVKQFSPCRPLGRSEFPEHGSRRWDEIVEPWYS